LIRFNRSKTLLTAAAFGLPGEKKGGRHGF
jgi:hypothetical protein